MLTVHILVDRYQSWDGPLQHWHVREVFSHIFQHSVSPCVELQVECWADKIRSIVRFMFESLYFKLQM